MRGGGGHALGRGVDQRGSEDRTGPALVVPATAWTALTAHLRHP
ncbi:DUF397 domain-containing protein [Streptomyces phytohabitans]